MPEPLDDPELWEVFREEMPRPVRAGAGPRGDASAWRAALHAMRGASAMMGLDELAAELSGLDEGLRALCALCALCALFALCTLCALCAL